MFLKELTQAFGVSGYEKEVADMIVKNIKEDVDELQIDALGNVIALKKGNGDHKKRIMVSSHMDEIGFSVLKITDEGFLKVKKMGGISAHTSYMNRIRFKNGGYGVIGCTEKIEKIEATDIHNLYIDIGAGSREKAAAIITVGEPACYVGEYQTLSDNCVTAKALDDRIGCYVLSEAIKKVSGLYNDVFLYSPFRRKSD